MTWINLGNPKPHKTPQSYMPYKWESSAHILLDAPEAIIQSDISTVFSRRRSARTFNSLSLAQLGSFLWLSSRTVLLGPDELGFHLTKRPCPSAGAIHPIHILALHNSDIWSRYDPDAHALLEVKEPMAGEIKAKVTEVLDPQAGTILYYVAEPGKTEAKYENANSLIWRDAGAMLGIMTLAAEALCLNFCPLGITGQEWTQDLDQKGRLAGVGLALLGAR